MAESFMAMWCTNESYTSGVSHSTGQAGPPRIPSEVQNQASYCTFMIMVVLCVIGPLLAVSVMLKLPVGVPLTTAKFIGAEAPPPGLGFVTMTGY